MGNSSGIWTPVENSTRVAIFNVLPRVFADKLKSVTLVAGNHMRINNHGCQPVYVSLTAPTTDQEGFQGTAVYGELVMPRAATLYIYCPHEMQTVHVGVGTRSTVTMSLL